MDDDIMMDVMMTEATATLYAMEHERIVSENFDSLYELIVASFNDEAFLEHLRNLKPRGMVTKGIKVVPENDALCFASKLWFNIQKSGSEKWEWYYLSIGVNLKETDMNWTGFKKLWLAHRAHGNLSQIQQKVNAEGFKEDSMRRLAAHVYNSCYEAIRNLMGGSPIPTESTVPETCKEEEGPGFGQKCNPAMLEIDFGSALKW